MCLELPLLPQTPQYDCVQPLQGTTSRVGFFRRMNSSTWWSGMRGVGGQLPWQTGFARRVHLCQGATPWRQGGPPHLWDGNADGRSGLIGCLLGQVDQPCAGSSHVLHSAAATAGLTCRSLSLGCTHNLFCRERLLLPFQLGSDTRIAE